MTDDEHFVNILNLLNTGASHQNLHHEYHAGANISARDAWGILDDMKNKGLVKQHPTSNFYSLDTLGREVLKAGNWIAYLEKEKQKAEKIANDTSEMDALKKKNLELSNAEYEYKETLRLRDKEIEVLRAENLRLSNQNTANQIKAQPLNDLLKWVDLIKVVATVISTAVGVIALEYQWNIVTRMLAYLGN